VRETVQLYVRDDVTSASWADRELKAYRQVLLAAGESQRVRIELPVAACTIVDAAARRIVEPGEFDVLVGPSSREEALLVARFTVR
jgi:beta-glucosidase